MNFSCTYVVINVTFVSSYIKYNCCTTIDSSFKTPETKPYLPGSPFQFTVGPLRDSGAHLVKAGGVGLERGEAGRSNEFNVWTREAGAGQLAISLEGPSKAEIDFKDRRDGSCDVSYKVDEPGKLL